MLRTVSPACAAWLAACALLTSASLGAQPPSPAMERISFAEAVARAAARNPSVGVALEEIRRAEALVRQSQALWLPVLTGNAAYTRLDGDRRTTGFIFVRRDSGTANLNLTVPVLAPARWLASSRAGEQVEVQKASAEDVRRTVALAAGRAYLTVIAARRFSQVSVRARDNARAHFDYAHTRRAAGVGNRIDEVRAAQELAADESQLRSNLSALARAQEALGVLLAADAPVDAQDEANLGEKMPPELGRALEDARDLRPDVQAQRKRLDFALHLVRDGWADYAPLITAAFQPSYTNPASVTLPETAWQAQLVLTLPLYDGGFRYGAQRERKALAAEQAIALEATVRQAASEVRAAFTTLQLADEALGSAREAAQLASEGLKLADLAYRAGAVNNLEVIDAERRARDADSVTTAAEDASRQARLDLFAATGHFP
jgi:outer membrane protein TolC